MLEIISMGSGMTLQDAGRPGWRRFGVPPGGAIDRSAMRMANRLLGNRPDAVVLEIALQGAVLRVVDAGWLALSGGDFCAELSAPAARYIRAGSILSFEQKGAGRYAYLAVPGGLRAPTWFGSAGIDPRSGMGEALEKGQRLYPVWAEPPISTCRVARRWPSLPTPRLPKGEEVFALFRGPQYAAFDHVERQRFIETEWALSTQADRTGYRLEGSSLFFPESIPSEPVIPGSFQIPNGGVPIVTMPDGPTVGGYAKIAVLAQADLDRFGQCRPGTKLKFSWRD